MGDLTGLMAFDNGVVTGREAQALAIWALTWPMARVGYVDWSESGRNLQRVFGVLAAA